LLFGIFNTLPNLAITSLILMMKFVHAFFTVRIKDFYPRNYGTAYKIMKAMGNGVGEMLLKKMNDK